MHVLSELEPGIGSGQSKHGRAPAHRRVSQWLRFRCNTTMAITMAVPKCSRLVCAIVSLAGLVLLAGTQQTCQGGVLWFAQTYPCSLFRARGSAAEPPLAEPPAFWPLTTEDPATAAFAICLVIKDQADDLREVGSTHRLSQAPSVRCVACPQLWHQRCSHCQRCSRRRLYVCRGCHGCCCAAVPPLAGLAVRQAVAQQPSRFASLSNSEPHSPFAAQTHMRMRGCRSRAAYLSSMRWLGSRNCK